MEAVLCATVSRIWTEVLFLNKSSFMAKMLCLQCFLLSFDCLLVFFISWDPIYSDQFYSYLLSKPINVFSHLLMTDSLFFNLRLETPKFFSFSFILMFASLKFHSKSNKYFIFELKSLRIWKMTLLIYSFNWVELM